MSWPPEGAKPPQRRPQKPPLTPPPALTSPGEGGVRSEVKQVRPKPGAPEPTSGIDPRKAVLLLGVPAFVLVVVLLVLFAPPVVLWIAGGCLVALVAGVLVLRKHPAVRSRLSRLRPGGLGGRTLGGSAGRPGRATNGRFTRGPGGPLGRLLGRRPGGRSGGAPGGRPGGATRGPLGRLGQKMRSLLPTRLGGTRPPGGRPGSGGSGRPPGRIRSALSRLRPGGRRPSATGGSRPSGGGRGSSGPGGSSPGGSKPSQGRGRRLLSTLTRPFKAARNAASKLLPNRPKAPPTGKSKGSGKGRGPSSSGDGKSKKGKPSPSSGSTTPKTRRVLSAVGRTVKSGWKALLWPITASFPDKKTKVKPPRKLKFSIDDPVGEGDPHYDEELAKAVDEASAETRKPKWPDRDPDPPSQPTRVEWPAVDADVAAPTGGVHPRPRESQRRTVRDHDPPDSRPSPRKDQSPPRRETPRITSANTTGGAMKSADAYVEMIDNSTPATVATTCEQAAEQARRDATEKEEEAKGLRREAETFDSLPGAGNKAAAQKLRIEAGKCEQDAKNRLQWASRLNGMARDATAKLAG